VNAPDCVNLEPNTKSQKHDAPDEKFLALHDEFGYSRMVGKPEL
jgi:hypothetical protein